MYLGKDWYFRWENFIINSLLILLYLNIRHEVSLFDNLVILAFVIILSFKKITVENKGLRVNQILYKWEDFCGLQTKDKKVKVFYKKYFFISTLGIAKKYKEILEKNILS